MRKSLIEMAHNEGYSTREFTVKILEMLVEMSIDQIDQKNIKDNTNVKHINWTISSEGDIEYKISVTKSDKKLDS